MLMTVEQTYSTTGVARLFGLRRETFNRKFLGGQTLWPVGDELYGVMREPDPDRKGAWRYRVIPMIDDLVHELDERRKMDRIIFTAWQNNCRYVEHLACLVHHLYEILDVELPTGAGGS